MSNESIIEDKAAIFNAKPIDDSLTPDDDQKDLWKAVFSRPIAGGVDGGITVVAGGRKQRLRRA